MSLDIAAVVGSAGTAVVGLAGWYLAQRKDNRDADDRSQVLASLVDKSIAEYLARLEARISLQDTRITSLEAKLSISQDALDAERAQRRCLDRKVDALEVERTRLIARVQLLENQVRDLGGIPPPNHGSM